MDGGSKACGTPDAGLKQSEPAPGAPGIRRWALIQLTAFIAVIVVSVAAGELLWTLTRPEQPTVDTGVLYPEDSSETARWNIHSPVQDGRLQFTIIDVSVVPASPATATGASKKTVDVTVTVSSTEGEAVKVSAPDQVLVGPRGQRVPPSGVTRIDGNDAVEEFAGQITGDETVTLRFTYTVPSSYTAMSVVFIDPGVSGGITVPLPAFG